MKKILSALLCILLLLTSAVGCVGCSETPEQAYERQKALYNDIISQYTALLTAKHNGEELSAPNTDRMNEKDAAVAEALYEIVDACKNAQAAERFGYGYKDLDGNGTPELLIMTTYSSIHAIFTVSGNKPILLARATIPGHPLTFADSNLFFIVQSTVTDNIEEGLFDSCRVDGDKIAYNTVCGKIYDRDKKETVEIYQMVEGNRVTIDDETFNILYRDYLQVRDSHSEREIKLMMPRGYFPLTDGDDLDEGLLSPVADFSSYAAIRNTYIAISRCLDEKFDSMAWTTGAYDNLFSFSNDRAFEYYNQLLYTAYSDNQPMGYDEIDLNGDGLDELVLLNEKYQIKAIFTQKNGVPVLVDSFAYGYQTCWLDNEGLIHVDFRGYYELEYSVYEYTESGEYKHHYSIVADNRYGRCLKKDGKIELISFEESLELLYNNYVSYSEPFDPNEYTRQVSLLTYTPLVEATDDIIEVAADKTWYKYANLERSSGITLAHSETYVTFENVTDAQMDMNIKYVFIFTYPDPERDNYLLTDSTESTLKFTVRKENGIFSFDGNGIQGKLEFGEENLWIIIEESTDERLPAGFHCHEEYKEYNTVKE